MKKWLYIRRSIQFLIIGILLVQNFDKRFIIGDLNSMSILGVTLANPFTVLESFLGTGEIYLPLIIASLIVLAFYLIVGGRTFCGWICPLHLVLEFTDKIRNRISVSNNVLPRGTKFMVLGLVLVITVATGVPVFEILSPINSITHAIVFGVWMGLILVAGIILFEIAFMKRGWCKYLCPMGAFYSLLGWLSLVRVRIDKLSCTKCMLCKEVCLEPHVLESPIRGRHEIVVSGECTNCGACIDRCEQGALGFSFRFFTKERRYGQWQEDHRSYPSL